MIVDYMKQLFLISFFVLAFAGCSNSSTNASPVGIKEGYSPKDTETPKVGVDKINRNFSGDVAPLWELANPNRREWTNFVYAELDRLGADLLDVIPSDSEIFCPNYSNLNYEQRKQYWAFLLSAMSFFESSFNPVITNPLRVEASNPKVARGLLQLSSESVNYYDCQIQTPTELHDPYRNLSCGIRVLNQLVGQDGRIAGKVGEKWKGGARYWSVLRDRSGKDSYKNISKWSSSLTICK